MEFGQLGKVSYLFVLGKVSDTYYTPKYLGMRILIRHWGKRYLSMVQIFLNAFTCKDKNTFVYCIQVIRKCLARTPKSEQVTTEVSNQGNAQVSMVHFVEALYGGIIE